MNNQSINLKEYGTKSLWLNFQYYPINWLKKTDVITMEVSSGQQIYVMRFEPETLRIRSMSDNHYTSMSDFHLVTSQHSTAQVVKTLRNLCSKRDRRQLDFDVSKSTRKDNNFQTRPFLNFLLLISSSAELSFPAVFADAFQVLKKRTS